jgi:hypothetical protein
VAAGSGFAPAENCDMPCTGNAKEACGGLNALNLYWSGTTEPLVALDDASPSATFGLRKRVASAAPAAQSLAIKPVVGVYHFQGCWTEATSERALSGASYYDYPAMTLEECANDCAAWDYFGVEYGGECGSTASFASAILLTRGNRLLRGQSECRISPSGSHRL